MFKLWLYLGPYIAYFTAWFIVLLALDILHVYKGANSLLLRSSYKSKVYKQLGSPVTVEAVVPGGKARVIQWLEQSDSVMALNKHTFVQDRDDLIKDSVTAVGRSASDKSQVQGRSVNNPMLFSDSSSSSSRMIHNMESNSPASSHNFSDKSHMRLRLFYDYVSDRRTLLGCEDVLYQGGLKPPLLCGRLRKGLAEDFILHLLNNHNILSCSFSAKGSSFTRHERRVCWISQHSTGFVMVAFSESALVLLGLPVGIKIIANVAVIRPLAMSIGSGSQSVFLWLRLKSEVYVNVLQFLIMAAAGVMLVFAALLTPPNVDKYYVILRYFLQVHMLSFFVDIYKTALLYKTTFHFGLYFGPKNMMNIGQVLCEVIVKNGLVEDLDYKHYRYYLPFDIVRIDYIVPVDPAVVESLLQPTDRSEDGDDVGAPSSAKHTLYNMNRQDSGFIATQVNPMLLLKREREAQAGIERNSNLPTTLRRGGQEVLGARVSPLSPPPPPPIAYTAATIGDRGSSTPPDKPPLTTKPMCVEMKASAVNADDSFAEGDDEDGDDEDGEQTTGNRDRTYGDCEEMEDMTISLKKFQPQIRKDYKDKFHFWQARMKGYTDAGDLEQADIHSLQRAATVEDSGGASTKSASAEATCEARIEVQAIAADRRGSVMTMAQQFEKQY